MPPPCEEKKASKRQNISSGQWRNCLGRFKMQALTDWDANITSTRTAVGQFKGQFKGAMDESSEKVQDASTHK